MLKLTQNRVCSAALLLTALTAFQSAAFAAPAVPKPQESLGERPAREAAVENDLPGAPARAGDVSFTLTAVTVEPDGLRLDDGRLSAITAPFLGHPITGRELGEMLTALSGYARESGYPAAAAYVPEQTATEGRLLVRFLPGRVGRVKLENESRLSTPLAKGIAARVEPGAILTSRDAETALLLLDNLSGVRAAAALAPGEKPGETDLVLRLHDDKAFTGVVYAENYGSRSSGRYRYGLALNLEDVGGTGGRLSAGTLISNHKQHAYSLNWEMPVGHSATRLGVGFSRSDYELGSVFTELGAQGMSNTYSFYGETPLWQTSQTALAVTYGFDHREMRDEMNGFSWKKHSDAFHAGIEGMGRGDGNFLRYGAELRAGTLTAGSDIAETLGQAGNTLGGFTKLSLDLTAIQSLGHSTDLMFKAQGQLANRNLDSSEQIYLGGAQGVRAYPHGEASGDEGVLGTLELRYHTPLDGLTLSAYLDAGHVRLAKDGAAGSETLKGWGIGVGYNRGGWFARLDYARRIGQGNYPSNDARSRQRMWFLAGFRW